MGRNYSAGFGIEEEKAPSANKESSPIGGPIPTGGLQLTDPRILSSIKLQDQANATDAQKQVASFLGNPDAQAKMSGRNYEGTFSNLDLDSKPPEPEEKPWYESGTFPQLQPKRESNYATLPLLNRVTEPKIQTPPESPQFKAMQETLKNETELKQAYEQAVKDEHASKVQEHLQKKSELQAQHDAAEAEHAQNKANYHRALAEHTYAKTMTPEMMMRQQGIDTEAPESIPTEVTLKKSPLGGKGTQKYAEEFGATTEESGNVGSMRSMQKENIPRQQTAFDVVNKEFPNMPITKYEESPLFLAGTTGEEYLKEKMQPIHEESIAEQERLREIKLEKERIADRLVQHKAQTQLDLEISKLLHDESAQRLKDARKQLESHKAPEAPKNTPSETRSNLQQNQKIAKLEERIGEIKQNRSTPMINKYVPKLGGLAFDEYTNTYPTNPSFGTNGRISSGDMVYANQLIQALRAPNLDEKSRDAFTSELEKINEKNNKTLPIVSKYLSENPNRGRQLSFTGKP
jgi:hypothetical protein